MVTRIERPRSRLCVFLLGIAFLGVFVVLLGIGDAAPSVLLVLSSKDDDVGQQGYDRRGEINTYRLKLSKSREEQLFWMDVRLSTGDGLLDDVLPVKMELDMVLTVHSENLDEEELDEVETRSIKKTQSCRTGQEWCDYFFLWKQDFVKHEHFVLDLAFADPQEYLDAHGSTTHHTALFDVESRVTSINPDFTRFEIGWKYFWLCMTLLVMFLPGGVGFLSALKRKRRDTGIGRTYHQRWTAVLLWGLVWFNDPFVAATVYTDWAKLWSGVFILSASTFVFLILLFWLCFLSDLRFMQSTDGSSHRSYCCYWLPKLILTAAIGVTMFGGYMYYRFENTLSFDYTGVADEKKAAESVGGVLAFLLAVYMMWALLLVLRSCGDLRTISPSYILVYCITLITCLVAIVGVFVAAYYPYSTSSVAFVGIHGLLNLYVWTLAASFSPVRAASTGGVLGEKPGRASAVTGTDEGGDMNGWEDPMDSDFKAVEL